MREKVRHDHFAWLCMRDDEKIPNINQEICFPMRLFDKNKPGLVTLFGGLDREERPGRASDIDE